MFAPWRSQSSLRIAWYPITGKSFISFHEWELFQVLLSWLRSLQHTFVFPIYLQKPKDFKTMVDWQSSSQHEFELSFHCRLDLNCTSSWRYRRICESSYPVFACVSYKRTWTINNFRLPFFRKVLIKKFLIFSGQDWPCVSKKNDCWTLLSYSLLIVFTLGPHLAQRKKKSNWCLWTKNVNSCSLFRIFALFFS